LEYFDNVNSGFEINRGVPKLGNIYTMNRTDGDQQCRLKLGESKDNLNKILSCGFTCDKNQKTVCNSSYIFNPNDKFYHLESENCDCTIIFSYEDLFDLSISTEYKKGIKHSLIGSKYDLLKLECLAISQKDRNEICKKAHEHKEKNVIKDKDGLFCDIQYGDELQYSFDNECHVTCDKQECTSAVLHNYKDQPSFKKFKSPTCNCTIKFPEKNPKLERWHLHNIKPGEVAEAPNPNFLDFQLFCKAPSDFKKKCEPVVNPPIDPIDPPINPPTDPQVNPIDPPVNPTDPSVKPTPQVKPDDPPITPNDPNPNGPTEPTAGPGISEGNTYEPAFNPIYEPNNIQHLLIIDNTVSLQNDYDSNRTMADMINLGLDLIKKNKQVTKINYCIIPKIYTTKKDIKKVLYYQKSTQTIPIVKPSESTFLGFTKCLNLIKKFDSDETRKIKHIHIVTDGYYDDQEYKQDSYDKISVKRSFSADVIGKHQKSINVVKDWIARAGGKDKGVFFRYNNQKY